MILRQWISVCCCGTLFAQPPKTPTFQTTTNLIIVNVSVRDKSGKLLDNLKKDDFILTEDDKPQSISVFEVEHLSSEALPPAVPIDNGPGLKSRPTKATPTAPVAAADAPGSRRDKRLLALYFDFSSMQPQEQIRAQQAALKFLNQQMTASDLVGILTYTNRLRVMQDFTNDRELLLSEIQGFRVGEAAENAVDGATGPDATDDSGSFTPDETEFNIFNTDLKLTGLETAVKKLAMYPEKKALIYFSSGISRTGVDNESQLRATANAAFYPVDARGLVAMAPGGDASTASASGTGIFTGKTQQGLRDKFNTSQETLATLAADTGGKALLDSNDLTMGITQAQRDINTYYILGYYSTNSALDGKYRRIKVRLKSDLEAKLDYRNGYYAGKVFQKFTASDKERQLEEALTLGDPFTELPLAVETDYF